MLVNADPARGIVKPNLEVNDVAIFEFTVCRIGGIQSGLRFVLSHGAEDSEDQKISMDVFWKMECKGSEGSQYEFEA